MIVQSGANVPNHLGPYMGQFSALTKMPLDPGYGPPPNVNDGVAVVQGATPSASGGVNNAGPTAHVVPVTTYLFGLLVLLIGLKYLSEHEKAKMQVAVIGIGVWNWVVITLMAILGITVSKAIFNRYPVRGITQIVNSA